MCWLDKDRELAIYTMLPYIGKDTDKLLIARSVLALVLSAEAGRPLDKAGLKDIIYQYSDAPKFQGCRLKPVEILSVVLAYKDVWMEQWMPGGDDFNDDFVALARSLGTTPEALEMVLLEL